MKKLILAIILMLAISISVYSAPQQVAIYSVTYAATKALQPVVRGESQYYMSAITGNCAITIGKTIRGDIVTFFLTSDAVGGHVMTFGNYFTSTGTMALIANQTSIIQFVYTGTTWTEAWRINGTASSIMPLATKGDILYASAANTWSNLAKNTTATRYLSNTGADNVPAWAQVALATGVSGTLPTANGGVPATRVIDLYRSTLRPSPDGANNSGVLTSEYDRTNYLNFTRWTSGTATQDYDVLYEFLIPTDFASFSADALSIMTRSNDNAGNVITISMYDGANSVDAGISSADIKPNADNTWQTKTDTPTATYAAGDKCHILIHLGNDEASNTIDFSSLKLTYNTR